MYVHNTHIEKKNPAISATLATASSHSQEIEMKIKKGYDIYISNLS